MAIDDSYSKVLLHMNGSDGSTTFTDESGKTWTRSGNAQIDTAQYKFGGASGLFDGSGDYVSTPDHADFAFGNGNFTIDFWFKQSAVVSQYKMLVGQWGGTQHSWQCMVWNSDRLNFSVYTTTQKTVGGVYVRDTNWHHYAAVRYGAIVSLYLDGASIGTPLDIGTESLKDSTNNVIIGRNPDATTWDWNGWIDEVRISKGIARWTGNFTPPNVEYGMGGQVIIWTSE